MKRQHLLIALLTSLAIPAHAAETSYYFKFSDLMQSEAVQKLLDPAVKLYWAEEPMPEFPEVARPDRITRSSISPFFGGSKKHCVDAFEKSLKDTIGNARKSGHDAVINIRATRDRKPTDDPLGFSCKPGFYTTEVGLWTTFARTSGAAQRVAEAERLSADVPARPPAEGAIFLPLDSVLASPEAQAVLGPDIKAYVGLSAPEYREREGPDDYSEEVEVGSLSDEDACKQAVIKTLRSMVEDAQEKHFDSIVKIRSYLNDQFAPVITDVECQLIKATKKTKKMASVTLQSSLVSKKGPK